MVNLVKKLLFVVVICLASLVLNAQPIITLTFTGQDTSGSYLQLNRVVVTNLSRNWTETIYWPDTVLEMRNSTRVAEHVASDFSLEQNIPNPFDGPTTVQLRMVETEKTILWVSDLSGKELVRYEGLLSNGTHRFRLSLPNAQVYILHAQTDKYSASIKLVNKGNAGSCMLEYEGQTLSYTPSMGKAMKGSTNQPFVSGDMMEYVGYVVIDGMELESEHIIQAQYDSQSLTLRFQFAIERPCHGTIMVTDYDGNIYNTVQIGNQCWMRENLRTEHYTDGTEISMGNTYSNSTPYRYAPDNDQSLVAIYGYLYNWPAVMHSSASSSVNRSGVQGICPIGWHVPSEAEWMQLIDYVSSQSANVCNSNTSYIAKSLAATIGWTTHNGTCAIGNNMSSNNVTGFSALPAGFYYRQSYFTFGDYVGYWSATENSNGKVFGHGLIYYDAIVYNGESDKDYAISVRCLLDDEPDPVVPTVNTAAVYTQMSFTSAISGGIVTATGGADVTARGVCWSTSPLPTLADSYTVDGSGTGNFSSNITGLTAGTSYYMRAYATNSVGTAYGNQVVFTTPDVSQTCQGAPSVTDYDGNIYNTVQIGNQCWMRENMRTTHYADGTSISVTSTFSNDSACLYVPNGNPDTYGYLYNWTAIMHNASSSSTNPSGVQGVCPNGWHVPSDDEWTQLANYLSSYYICGSNNIHIAKSLAASSGWNTCSDACTVGNDQDSNNSTGFSAFPVGNFSFISYNYYQLGARACLWSATETEDGYVWYRFLLYNRATMYQDYTVKNNGLSVRCLRD